jgi:integrase
MAKVRLILHNKIYPDNRRAIALVFTHKGKTRYRFTGIRVLPEQFNGSWVVNHESTKPYNNNLLKQFRRAEDKILELDYKVRGMTMDQLLFYIDKVEAHSEFIGIRQFGADFVKRLQEKGKIRTSKIYEATLDRLEEFTRLAETPFEDIDRRFLEDFETFLLLRGNTTNGINLHMRNIRALFNRAIDDDLISAGIYPFRRYKLKTRETPHLDLTKKEIKALLEVTDLNEWEEKARDFFFLQFYLIGINVIDLFNAPPARRGRVEFSRAKTSKAYSIKLEPEALEIIKKYKGKKYLLHFAEKYKNNRTFYSTYQSQFKELAKKAKIPHLSSYYSRHTWATFAADLEIPKETISAALGHGKSITDIYIRFNLKKIDEANRKVIDCLIL